MSETQKTKFINLNVSDFVKIILGVAFAGFGYNANEHVSNVAMSMSQVTEEISKTKKEIMNLNETMIRVVTTQEHVIQRVEDHESRLRDVEKIKPD